MIKLKRYSTYFENGYEYNGIRIYKGYPSFNSTQCWIMECKDKARYFRTLKDVKKYIETGEYKGR